MGGSPEYQSFMLAAATVLAGFAIVVVMLLPFMLRRRRRREQRELHDKIKKAKADILEDGVVEGPKGPYVPHRRSGVKTELWPPHDTRPPKANAYHGMPWP